MKIEGVPYKTVNWNEIPAEEHKGETGAALWRTFSQGNVRARVVEYGPGYLADHWCPRGDGSKEELTAGMGYVAEDDEHNRHRSFSPNGAKLFIVD